MIVVLKCEDVFGVRKVVDKTGHRSGFWIVLVRDFDGVFVNEVRNNVVHVSRLEMIWKGSYVSRADGKIVIP